MNKVTVKTILKEIVKTALSFPYWLVLSLVLLIMISHLALIIFLDNPTEFQKQSIRDFATTWPIYLVIIGYLISLKVYRKFKGKDKIELDKIEKLALFKVVQYGMLTTTDLETFLKVPPEKFANVIDVLDKSNLIQMRTSKQFPNQQIISITFDGMTEFGRFRKDDIQF